MAATEVRERDIDAEIAALDRKRFADYRITGHSLRGWLYTHRVIQRLVPDRIAMRIAWAVGWLRWYWPPARRRAIARVSLTVKGTPREGEERKLARRELAIQTMRVELSFRRRHLDRVPVDGWDRLERALSSERPTLLTGAHIGMGGNQVIARSGIPFAAAAGTWMDPDADIDLHGFHGHRVRAWRWWCDHNGVRLVTAGDSYPLLRTLLERGETCYVATDVPGQMRTRMAGKAACLASGPAMLAHETGALVVPLVALLHAGGLRLEVLEPIDPWTLGGPQEIADRLAEIYGDLMVRHPEQVEPSGFLKWVFAEDAADCPLDLWYVPALRTRVKLALRGAASRARQQLRR